MNIEVGIGREQDQIPKSRPQPTPTPQPQIPNLGGLHPEAALQLGDRLEEEEAQEQVVDACRTQPCFSLQGYLAHKNPPPRRTL